MTYADLTNEQRRRYNRHIILDGFGKEGQMRLLNAKVLIVGAGGLGSPIAMYLAAAGVGTIGLVDGDTVSLTNLQRQVIHTTADVGRPKVDSAAEKIRAINPDVRVEKHEIYLNEDNALDIMRPYDYVVEGSDNFSAKYLVNDACVMLGKPFCIGGINRWRLRWVNMVTSQPSAICCSCSLVGVASPKVEQSHCQLWSSIASSSVTSAVMPVSRVKLVTLATRTSVRPE